MQTVNKSKHKEKGLGKILSEDVSGYIARSIEHNDAVNLFDRLLSQLSRQRKISISQAVDLAIEYCCGYHGNLSNHELVVDFLQSYKTSMMLVEKRHKTATFRCFQWNIKSQLKISERDCPYSKPSTWEGLRTNGISPSSILSARDRKLSRAN